jgi:hypothetical protein
MSVALLIVLVGLTLAQLVSWESFGATYGFAASVSFIAFSVAVTLISAMYVAATREWGKPKTVR